MTLHASRNSVAGQIEGRPLNMCRSIADTPLKAVALQLAQYAASIKSKQVRPEEHALQFYMLEHASGLIRAKYGPHDDLPKGETEILDDYNRQGLAMAARAYYYLLLICWREMRHCQSKPTTFVNAGEHVGVDPAAMQTLLAQCSDTHEYGNIAAKWQTHAGDITLGQLTRALVYGYRKGKWSSAYGGPKWAVVAECLSSFVHGKTSAAMMLDTVWTLAHNTAPIFNKGMLYSGQDSYVLLEILDVQRAGMIPQYILTARQRGYAATPFISKLLERKVQLMGRTLGGDFLGDTDVDWPAVKALGAIGKYGHYEQKLGQTAEAKPAPSPLEKQLHASIVATQTVKKLVPGVVVTFGRAS